MLKERYDKIIIGAGLYGLYATSYCSAKGQKVLLIECEKEAFARATYVNQARVHRGYHYPRSLSTALKSAGYFQRFVDDFGFCIHDKFCQVYAVSSEFSWTNAKQFESFCRACGVPCEEINPNKYFNEGTCDGAFLTDEYTYDARILRDYFVNRVSNNSSCKLLFGTRIKSINKTSYSYEVETECGEVYEAPFVLNATYAAVNQIIKMVNDEQKNYFDIKYELCEIILTEPAEKFKGLGITVMDGPFFSIMPFGKTGYHSLTSVTFTPHIHSKNSFPVFSCQKGNDTYCSSDKLGNCNVCNNHPESAWSYMSHLANKYIKEEYGYSYVKSLYSMKPILQASELDDSRPTAIRKLSNGPTLISVLSGKINTVYDLDQYLD